jgi:hypothetical protein
MQFRIVIIIPFVAGALVTTGFLLDQARATHSSTPRPTGSRGTAAAAQIAAGSSITRVKMQSDAPPAIKSTSWLTIMQAKMRTEAGKNQLIRIRFTADTHCRAMTSTGAGSVCQIRFLMDGDPSFALPLGRADFLGSQTQEDYWVFFNKPKLHNVQIQVRAPNTNVWLYIQPWVATVERVNGVSKE